MLPLANPGLKQVPPSLARALHPGRTRRLAQQRSPGKVRDRIQDRYFTLAKGTPAKLRKPLDWADSK